MGNTSQVTSTPPSSPLKCGRLISHEDRRCCRRVLLGLVANGTLESRSLAVEEEPSD
jgi:hypothetical protein